MSDAVTDFLAHAQQVQSYTNLALSEADTRAYLIDPVLRLLGYVTVADIRREVPVPATKEFLDYELYVDGKAQAIVEAKALRHSVTDQAAAQCVQYAAILGVRWCIITNGLTWAVYNAHANGPLAEKRVAVVALDGDERSIIDAWEVLSLFARDALVQTSPLSQLLAERVVIDELSRPDSPAVAALRKAIQSRFGERVSGQVVVAAVEKARGLGQHEPANRVAETVKTAPSRLPDGQPAIRSTRSPQAVVKSDGGAKVSVLDLLNAGLLADDAALECTHKGVSHLARVRGDRIEMSGTLYPTLSAAAAIARGGTTNGWEFWSYQGATLAQLRAQYLVRQRVADSGAG